MNNIIVFTKYVNLTINYTKDEIQPRFRDATNERFAGVNDNLPKLFRISTH
jgi:hypothetical protein